MKPYYTILDPEYPPQRVHKQMGTISSKPWGNVVDVFPALLNQGRMFDTPLGVRKGGLPNGRLGHWGGLQPWDIELLTRAAE